MSAFAVLAPLAIRVETSVAQEPQIQCELSQDRIYLGESVRYRVMVQHVDPTVEPQLAGFDDFAVRSLGKSTGIQSTVIVNGRVQSFSQGGPTLEYLLTPKRSGRVTVPGPTLTVAGKEYRGPALQLEVLDPSEQDVVVMELSSNRTAVYPMQPFALRLTVAVKGLPEPLRERDPTSVQQQLPQLVLPWADDENLPPGVAPREPAGDWLRDYIATRRGVVGFGINNIRTAGGGAFGGAFPDIDELLSQRGFPDPGSVLSMFSEERRAAFQPEPTRVMRKDARGGTAEYWEYTFERVFHAQKLGPVTFGPATLKGVFATQANTRGELQGDRIYAVAKPMTVEVKDAPLAGRPDSYIHAIGKFDVGAELSPDEVKVGDPLTLVVRVSGTGTLEDITPPQLDKDPRISEAFKLYEATETTSGDTRKFTFNLRPRRAGAQEFPAIPLSYFDYSREEFVTVTTPPIPLKVAVADQLAEADIAMVAGPTTSRSGPEASAAGIFANITEVSQLHNQAVHPERWCFALGGMASVFLVVSVTRHQWQRRRDDVAGQRRRGAVRRAMQRLDDLQRQVATSTTRPVADALTSAMTGLVADAAGVEELGLTSADVVRLLDQLGGDQRLTTRLAEFLESCDAARYGAGHQSLDSLSAQGRALCDDLAKALRAKKLVF